MKRLPLTLLLLAVASFAQAAETAWQEIAPGTHMRLISTDRLHADGTTTMAVEVELAPETKTYWRIPGETGIPTTIGLAGSTGIANAQVLWPFPSRETQYGFLDYVYYGHLVLPVVLEVDPRGAVAKAEILMGVCSDICVPVKAAYTLPLQFESPDVSSELRIRQALSEVPVSTAEAEEQVGAVTFDPDARRLAVEITGSQIDPETLIADTGNPAVLFGSPQKSPIAKIAYLDLFGRGEPDGLKNEAVRLTFMTTDGAFEVVRPLGALDARE